MYRQLILSTGALSITQQTTASVQLTRSLSSRTNNPNQKGAADVAFIKEWLASFTNNVKAIPSSILDIKHARSRHGNDKSSTKLICRASIDALRQYHVPQQVLEKVKESPHYRRGADAIETTSDKKGSTNSNLRDGIEKLHDVLREIAKDIITKASREPPRPRCKPSPSDLSTAEGRKRRDQRKKLQQAAQMEEKIARAREEKEKKKIRDGRNQ